MGQRRPDFIHQIEQELKASLTWAFSQARISPAQQRKLAKSFRECAHRLHASGEFCWDELEVDFYLLRLPEIGAPDFPFVLSIPRDRNFTKHKHGPQRLRKCFIGCRLDRTHNKFRRVLEGILGPYGYEVPPAFTGGGQILEDILKQLKSDEIDFALFDNRATERKPNVYIELGIAYTLGKPFLFFQHEKTVLPSDLGGFGTLRYSSYRKLARDLSLLLPRFLTEIDVPTWEAV